MTTINIETLSSSERDALLAKLLPQKNTTSVDDPHVLPSGMRSQFETLVEEFYPEDPAFR